jgi:hypothetical protein
MISNFNVRMRPAMNNSWTVFVALFTMWPTVKRFSMSPARDDDLCTGHLHNLGSPLLSLQKFSHRSHVFCAR